MAPEAKDEKLRLKVGDQVEVQDPPEYRRLSVAAVVVAVDEDDVPDAGVILRPISPDANLAFLFENDIDGVPRPRSGVLLRISTMRGKETLDGYAFCDDVVAATDDEPAEITIGIPTRSWIKPQRRWVRLSLPVEFTFSVSYSAAELDPEAIHTGQTRDIGAGGLRFETELPLETGDRLLLTIRFSADFSVRVKARVVYLIPPDHVDWHAYGVEFDGLPEDVQRRIVHYLFRTELETYGQNRGGTANRRA